METKSTIDTTTSLVIARGFYSSLMLELLVSLALGRSMCNFSEQHGPFRSPCHQVVYQTVPIFGEENEGIYHRGRSVNLLCCYFLRVLSKFHKLKVVWVYCRSSNLAEPLRK